jgi:putative heme degradation protein
VIPDDEPIPPDVLALAMRMAQQKLPPSNRDISAATGISEARLVRMRISGGLTYSGKRPAPPKKWSKRR